MAEKSPFELVLEEVQRRKEQNAPPPEQPVLPTEQLPQSQETPEQWIARVKLTHHQLGMDEETLNRLFPPGSQVPFNVPFEQTLASLESTRDALKRALEELQRMLQ